MSGVAKRTLCFVGCGNLGKAILSSLLSTKAARGQPLFTSYVACVRSEKSRTSLQRQFSRYEDVLTTQVGNIVKAVNDADVSLLAVDPADIEAVLKLPNMVDALSSKLLISVAAGWTRQKLEIALYGNQTSLDNQNGRARIVRTLPNIAAQVAQSLTAIETNPDVSLPEEDVQLVDSLFEAVGKVAHVPPRLMDATTAVAGSTPAFFTVICDAFIDAAVAVGMPRDDAKTMIVQSMLGTATLLQTGMHTAVLRDQGTAPEGCTIAGLMELEERAVRGHVGRALREAVTVARLMGNVPHPNDTRQ